MHAPANLAPAREEAGDWSGWEKWLESHLAIEREALAIERETLIQALGEVLGESRFGATRSRQRSRRSNCGSPS